MRPTVALALALAQYTDCILLLVKQVLVLIVVSNRTASSSLDGLCSLASSFQAKSEPDTPIRLRRQIA